MKEITPFNECTACGACINICNHSAIKFVEISYGCLYPQIDTSLCVDCGLCLSVCPNNLDIKLSLPKRAFAITVIDENIKKNSTSAGAAFVLAKFILRNNGVVYGCTGEDCWHVKHIRIINEEELIRLQGSKYVQSDIGLIFREVKKDLKNEKQVLFIGTPCQVAGLKAFLKKEYLNLYTIDFVCHGVPPQHVLTEVLKSYKKVLRQKQYSVSFRKKDGEGNSFYGLFLTDNKGRKIIDEVFPKNKYITAFLLGLFYRENCYSCKYACLHRVSDITLGDFWDDEGKYYKYLKCKNNLSSFLINSVKGEYLFSQVEKEIVLSPISLEEMQSRHEQLIHPLLPYRKRPIFLRLYKSKSINIAISKSLKTFYLRKRFSNIISLIERIPGVKYLYVKIKK